MHSIFARELWRRCLMPNPYMTPQQRIVAMIDTNKRKGGDRRFLKGYVLGRFCGMMDAQEIVDLFSREWPLEPPKLKITAEDFKFLQDLKIGI